MIRTLVLKWLPENLARVASIATSEEEQTMPWPGRARHNYTGHGTPHWTPSFQQPISNLQFHNLANQMSRILMILARRPGAGQTGRQMNQGGQLVPGLRPARLISQPLTSLSGILQILLSAIPLKFLQLLSAAKWSGLHTVYMKIVLKN